MMQSLESRFESVSFKAGVIAGLTLLMLWPLLRVESLVTERQVLQHQAYDVIAAGFGGAQIVGAPILTVEALERSVATNPHSIMGTETWIPKEIHLLPDDVQITSDATVEVRSKGIYSVPVYVSKIVITGRFAPESIARLLSSNAETRVLAAHAVIQLPLSDIKYLRNLARFNVGGQPLRAAGGQVAGFTALSAPIDLETIDRATALPFSLELEIAGSQSLQFLPLGSTTNVTAQIAWPHPDFDGAFLPVSHQLRVDGYTARWQILELNRALPQLGNGESLGHAALLGTAFGVRLYQPADIYSRNYRAVRYGILFVAITFACFFAWEHLVRGLRLHPLQYLLVGLALATFYLLLLALSEHTGFGMAYAAAAGALVALITLYIAGATTNPRSALGIGAALAASYGALYVILVSDDNALLYGSLLLFAILAALMLATRRFDWAKVGRGE
jgi:inner membrane protein